MLYITIVGGGVHGGRMAETYRKFPAARLRAVITPTKPKGGEFLDIPCFASATSWHKEFGRPAAVDVFDLCVHQDIMIHILEDLVRIGARNFVLPKPIALHENELIRILALQAKHKLKIMVGSQWHYSTLLTHIADFLKKNRERVFSIRISFSDSFGGIRGRRYTVETAFLPHILQILVSLGLLTETSIPLIKTASDRRMEVHYTGIPRVTVETDLTVPNRTQILEVFFKGERTPALTADFSRRLNPIEGKMIYPSISFRGKKKLVVAEDILEKMVERTLAYFGSSGPQKDTMTLQAYLPVAKAEIRILKASIPPIAVIGGGVFGITAALKIAERGYPVIVFEKERQIITGASLVNQCRVHRGYHYPRDEKTAAQSESARKHFESVFGPAIVKKLRNYYMVAAEGTMTSSKKYLAFCKKMRLPYTVSWPRDVKISKNKIDLSLRVPESCFDANTIRKILVQKLKTMPNIMLQMAAPVVGIKQARKDFNIRFMSRGEAKMVRCSAVINASYGATNQIRKLMHLPLRAYQYELCEVPVVRAPRAWQNTGWSIIDGPFFGVMPFGHAKEVLFYDVELSVLERSIGIVPNFKHNIDYYNTPERRQRRFQAYYDKWESWIPEVRQCKPLYSMYTTRVVLPRQEKTDMRPTILENPTPGFWQIFSGKVTTSVPLAAEIAHEVDAYLQSAVQSRE